jgi:hypothetical protein
MAMQNAQGNGGNNNPGQQNQMNPQQMHNLQQAQIAAAQQQQQQQQQQQGQAVSAGQPNQPTQAQSQPQQAQPNAQGQPQQPQQPQQQTQPQGQGLNPQQAAAAAAMLQQRQQQGEKIRGQCLMRLMLFADHLSSFGASSKPLQTYMVNGTQKMAAQGNKQRDDLSYWQTFVDRFFSPKGVLRHSLWITDDGGSNKQYEITYPALARYFNTHFESGVKTMQLIMEKGSERDLPNSGHYIESQKASFVYWFDTGAQVSFRGSPPRKLLTWPS